MKLLKTLKSLKNLQKSKLAKAVAMSLIVGSGVMGVSGNALAIYAPVYYTKIWTGSTWTHDISKAYRADVDFTWNKNWNDYVQIYAAVDRGQDYYYKGLVTGNTLTVKDGLIAYAYAGFSASKMEVKKNTLNLKGGTYGALWENGGGEGAMAGGRAYNAHCTANTVNVYEGNNIRWSGTIYGGYTNYGQAGDNVVNLYKGITVDSSVYGGRADHGAAVANTVNVNEGVTVGGTIFGGYSGEESVSNTVNVNKGATVGGNVYGGYSDRGSVSNTVNVNEGATVGGNVYGGYSDNESVGRNTVNLQKWSHVKGDVVAAFTDVSRYLTSDKSAYDNTVNVYGNVTVDGKVRGGITRNVPSRNNTLNVSGKNNHFGGLDGFQNLSFGAMGWYGSEAYGYVEMLSVKDAVDINSIDSIKVNAKATNSYATNVTLLYSPNSDFTNLDKTKLKLIDQYTNINGQKIVEEVTNIDVDKSRLSIYYKEDDIKDIDAIGAAVSYSVGKHSIDLATYAKLVNTFDVNDDITLDRGMILNDHTINMQDAKDTSADDVKYSTLAVDNILGNGYLKLDVDMSGGKDNIKNDKIYTNREYTINGYTFNHNKFNDATITVNDIIVRKDLPSTLTGIQEEKGEISVVEGDINGITLNVANGKVKTATSKYIYTFTPGEAGKLNFTQILPGTISEFIHAEGKYKYVSTLTLTDDEVADKNLDSLLSRFDKNRNITLNFNEGITLSGKKDNRNYDGVKVDSGYTFNLKGETGENPGKMTDFKNFAVKNEGTLNVENITFTNNKTFQGVATDIINESTGVVNFSGTNTATVVTNAGTLNLNGKNNIADISNTGTVNINGANTITKLSNDTSNTGIVNIDGTNSITDISNVGTVNTDGTNTITNLSNAGTVSLNGSKNTIATLNNNGTANLLGTNTITTVEGNGTLNINAGNTTVSGEFAQNAVNVKAGGSLSLNNTMNINTVNVEEGGRLEQREGALQATSMTNNGSLCVSNNSQLAVENFTNNGILSVPNDAELTIGCFEGTLLNSINFGTNSNVTINSYSDKLNVTVDEIFTDHFRPEVLAVIGTTKDGESYTDKTITIVSNPEKQAEQTPAQIAAGYDKALGIVEQYGMDAYIKHFEGDGKVIFPEGFLDGKTVFDKNGVHKARSANNDVVDSLATAASFARVEMNDIRKRMGDVRQVKDTNGMWARNENGKLEGSGVDAKFHKYQMGTDKAVSDKWRVGGAVSYTNGSSHYSRGSNSNKTYSGAAYGMYTGKKGEFVDVIARVGLDKTKLNFNVNTGGGTVHQQGNLDRMAFSLSSEVGKTYELKNNFYVEPQAELTYTYSGSDDFISNGVKYDLGSANSLVGRLGFTLGYKKAQGGVYTRLGVLREFSGDKDLRVTSGGYTKPYTNEAKDNWVEWAIGGQIQTSKATYIYADAEKTFGADVNEKYRVNVGLRYSF